MVCIIFASRNNYFTYLKPYYESNQIYFDAVVCTGILHVSFSSGLFSHTRVQTGDQ